MSFIFRMGRLPINTRWMKRDYGKSESILQERQKLYDLTLIVQSAAADGWICPANKIEIYKAIYIRSRPLKDFMWYTGNGDGEKYEFQEVRYMILKNKYPICEFDTSKDPLIHPANFLEKSLPEKCVITFFRKELDRFVAENNLPVIGYLNSEVFDIPVYEYVYGADRLCITMAFCGAPGAAVTLEELYAMGCKKFIICGVSILQYSAGSAVICGR